MEHIAEAHESIHMMRDRGCFCPLPDHFDSRISLTLSSLPPTHGREWCVETALGWGGVGRGGRDPSTGLMAASVTSLFLFSVLICYLADSSPQLCIQGAFIWRDNRLVHLEVFLVVNPKKNLRNFFWPVFFRFCFLFICPFPLADSLDSETQGHRFKYGKEIMALSTVRKNLALRHFLWATTKLQRLSPDKAFQRDILHRHCVSVSIISSCFSWCLLWPGLKWPLHGKHLPSRVRVK